jgi:hypothetical protein
MHINDRGKIVTLEEKLEELPKPIDQSEALAIQQIRFWIFCDEEKTTLFPTYYCQKYTM